MDKKLEKLITDILCFTELSTPDADERFLDDVQKHELKIGAKGMTRRNVFPLSYIGAVEPFMDEFVAEEDGRGYFGDVTPRDVNGQWDISIISKPHESWGDKGLFQLSRCRRKPLHEIRGHKLMSEYASEQSVAVLKQDGSYTSARSTAFYVGRDSNGFGRWASWNHGSFLLRNDPQDGDVAVMSRRPEESEEDCRFINTCLGSQFTRDYEWTVTVAVRNVGNPVLLTTDSTGARDMFGDREASGNRRAALEHWVEQHWRKRRKDPDSETFVRQHLRGAEEFIWKGFECALKPSPYDIRLAQRLIAEREEMKREGKTVRVRGNNASLA